MEIINQQIRAFLKKNPSQKQLTDYINNMKPTLVPQVYFNKTNVKELHGSTLVYARLMVQDIRDTYYYYSFITKRPIDPQGEYYLLKWGNMAQIGDIQIEENQYFKVMTERQSIICTGTIGLTSWMKVQQGWTDTIEVYVDGRSDFKLGEVVNIVAFYYPDNHKLYFVRKIQQNEAITCGINNTKINQQKLDYPGIRHELCSLFSSYCSPHFSQYLLLLLASSETLFLGAQSDISQLIQLIYPRVSHILLKYPCQNSLFPYKNQEGQLIQTQMQLSRYSTFVSIDFSQFSDKSQVKIGQKTIDNLKALKVFVQQGKTVYRWQYGQSLVDHSHFGIIVKGSSLLQPHFIPTNQCISPDFQQLKKIPQQKLLRLRNYIQQIRKLKPVLSQKGRESIQRILKQETDKSKLIKNLQKIMQLAKLEAKSHGRQNIEDEDFNNARHLYTFHKQ